MANSNEPIGAYAPKTATLEPDIYKASVETVVVVKDPDGMPTTNQSGKNLLDVTFRVDKDTTVRRRFPIGYGCHPATGKPSALSQFIASALPQFPNGDKRQRNVTPEDLIGKTVRIVTTVSPDGRYTNIESVLPAKAGGDESEEVAF